MIWFANMIFIIQFLVSAPLWKSEKTTAMTYVIHKYLIFLFYKYWYFYERGVRRIVPKFSSLLLKWRAFEEGGRVKNISRNVNHCIRGKILQDTENQKTKTLFGWFCWNSAFLHRGGCVVQSQTMLRSEWWNFEKFWVGM